MISIRDFLNVLMLADCIGACEVYMCYNPHVCIHEALYTELIMYGQISATSGEHHIGVETKGGGLASPMLGIL